MFCFQTTCLTSQCRESNPPRIINTQVGCIELFAGICQLLSLIPLNLAIAQAKEWDACLKRQESLHKWRLAHFKDEDAHRLLMSKDRVVSNREHNRGLPHAWPACKNNEM